ncbi:NAD(P)-binding domain-containing protein [Azohydromonas australica]|uniref:NAD(P)-binding domain-containing protein n=1 Tax=Azohydromonas australica TaxID=364039 RepID=UPI0004022603|nr:NAD(P)-binding domain-containing protein [Azohydromonas australica]
MRVAIIGLGEVGRCYAKPLHEAGFELTLCEAWPSAAASELAAQWGLPIHDKPGAWLASAQWVLSCVTGAQALAVVEQVVPHLAADTSLADFTTASPEVKRRAAQHAAEHGMRYVDTAIMGAISLNWVRTPLLASGDGAEDLKTLLEKAGGRVQAIPGGKAGDAISLKILRSVFTKGMEALSVELLTSAEKQGVRDKLYEQLSDIDRTPLRSFIDMLVRTHVVHAKRRAHEVHDAQGELAAQGLPSLVLPGVEQRFRDTAAKLEHNPLNAADPSVDQALQWLLATNTQQA